MGLGIKLSLGDQKHTYPKNSLGSYGFGYQIEFGRPKTHISKEFLVNLLGDYLLGLLGVCNGI